MKKTVVQQEVVSNICTWTSLRPFNIFHMITCHSKCSLILQEMLLEQILCQKLKKKKKKRATGVSVYGATKQTQI